MSSIYEMYIDEEYASKQYISNLSLYIENLLVEYDNFNNLINESDQYAYRSFISKLKIALRKFGEMLQIIRRKIIKHISQMKFLYHSGNPSLSIDENRTYTLYTYGNTYYDDITSFINFVENVGYIPVHKNDLNEWEQIYSYNTQLLNSLPDYIIHYNKDNIINTIKCTYEQLKANKNQIVSTKTLASLIYTELNRVYNKLEQWRRAIENELNKNSTSQEPYITQVLPIILSRLTTYSRCLNEHLYLALEMDHKTTELYNIIH